MPAQRLVAATRKGPVGTQACDNKRNERTEPAGRGVAVTSTNREGGGGTAVGGETRGKREGAIDLPLASGRTSLLDTAVIEEEADEEDGEDASGRSRWVHRNSSLDKLWPSALPIGLDAKGVPQQASLRTGQACFAPEPTGKAAPTAVRAGGVTSEKERNIFAMLGTPSGVSSAEAIDDRLSLLMGTLSIPRAIS